MSFRRRLLLSFFLILLVPVVLIVALFVGVSRETREAKSDARISGALPAVVAEYRSAVEAADRAARDVGRDPDFGGALAGPQSALRVNLERLARDHRLTWIQVVRDGLSVNAGASAPFAPAETRVRTDRGLILLRVAVTDPENFGARAGEVIDLPLAVGSGVVATSRDRRLPRSILRLDGPPPQTVDLETRTDELRARVFELRGEAGPPARIAIAAPLGDSVLEGRGALLALSAVVFVALAALATVFLLRGLGREHEGVVEQALTDGLTGLANHRHFREAIAQEVERSERYKHDVSVLLMDLDNFKQVNDTYGHPQGDIVLRRVADVLREESRNIDMPARYGGEEFAILLPETDLDGAAEFGERVRTRLQNTPIPVEGTARPLVMTASIGVAGTPENALSPSGLIDAADKALYEAKRSGKDRVARAGSGARAADAKDDDGAP